MAFRPRDKNTEVRACYKYILFLANFLFFISGGVLAGLGAWLLYEKKKVIDDVFDFLFDPAVLFCCAGCLVFVLSFFGCCGALRENQCFIKLYKWVMILLLVLEVLFGILVFIFFYAPSVRKNMPWLDPSELLKNGIGRYRDDPDLMNAIDNMQKELQCCGASNDDNGYLDWNDNIYFNCNSTSKSPENCAVPYSCCKLKDGELINVLCGGGTLSAAMSDVERWRKINTKGCLKAFGNWLEQNALLIGGACFGVIIPQIIGIVLSTRLNDQIARQKEKWHRLR
ncbi:tetraspanin-33-like [Lineus longissimus]|uniref:tetraspanin-33-like n=1 Tax=Lineus longissimus TaxID=88925 RepID=UPI002B4D5BBB